MNTNPGQIAPTSNVTLGNGGVLNLAAATSNTLNSVSFTGVGGTSQTSLNINSGLLTLSAANAITAQNDNTAMTPQITGGSLAFASASPTITASGLSANSLVVAAPIVSSGGPLTIAGNGAVTLSGQSTFTNGVNLNSGSIVFGAGSTTTSGTVSSGPLGTGTLTTANNTTILGGGVQTIGNAVVTNGNLNFGGVNSSNNLNLTGSVSMGGSNPTLTVVSPAVTANINGPLSGTAGLTKAGPGTLVVSAAASYSGATTITGGVLKLASVPTSPVTSTLLYDLDPSSAANYTLTGGNVTQLNDITGNGYNFTNASSTVTVVNGGSAFNGKNVLYFNSTANATLAMGKSTSPETVFIIENVIYGNGDGGIFGHTGADDDIRTDGGATPYFHNPGNGQDYTNGTGGAMYVNGVLSAGNVTAGTAQLIEAYAGASNTFPWSSTSLSNNTFMSRYFNGDMGEVIAYSGSLSAAQRQADEAYLMYKWFGIVEPGYGAGNLLPIATPVQLGNGGSLDLAGGNQQVASLADYAPGSTGSVINSIGTSTLTLSATGGTTVFSGAIAGGSSLGAINLVMAGSGVQVLAGANSYTGSTSISGGTLQIGNAGNSGTLGTGPVIDNSVLAFSRSDAGLNVANVISGNGTVTQLGPGVTAFTASNTYTGVTTISGGSLQLGTGIAGQDGRALRRQLQRHRCRQRGAGLRQRRPANDQVQHHRQRQPDEDLAAATC